ncbi:MAG TPA: sigma factor, partial [Allosphingosinicella sp.]
MPGPDDGSDGRDELAREAKPLRRLLVRYFSRRVPAGFEVDDLVQEVFLRIVARDSTSRIEHLGRYVHQTAASVVADLSRRRRARR